MFRRILSAIAGFLWDLFSFGFEKKYTVSRYGMYKRLENSFIGKQDKTVLSISHSQHLASIIGLSGYRVTEANFPEVNILRMPFDDCSFDFVLSDQVFEHIEGDPQKAFDECMRVLRPGGVAIHTTCFMNAYHGPGDYWRWTFEGLRFLGREHKVLVTDQWGGPFVFFFNFLGLNWKKVPENRYHPFNMLCRFEWFSWSSMVWVVAQKKEVEK